MITHVVLFRLSDPSEATEARDRLAALRGRVSAIRSLSVGVNVARAGSTWHVALTTTHDDWDALAAYQEAPGHREVIEGLDARVADRAAVDYEA